MLHPWRALFNRAERPERPLSLAEELSQLKARFKHSGRAVEAYIKQQPRAEWKPWFQEAVCHTLRDMNSNRHRMQDSETGLASPRLCQLSYLSLIDFENRSTTSNNALRRLLKSGVIRLFGRAQR